MKLEFKEEQKFTQWWLWLILIGIAILPVFSVFEHLLQEVESTKTRSVVGIIGYYLFVFAIIALFLIMRLKTEIDQNEITMQFVPFLKKRVSWAEIKSAKIVNYGFVGGWGIRFGTQYGTVYNIKGNKGLALELLNGKKFLIGTQKETELAKTIEKFRGKTETNHV